MRWIFFCFIFLLGACASTPSPSPTGSAPQPTLSGERDQAPPIAQAAPEWRSPARRLTRETIAGIEWLGRLDFSGTPSTVFSYAFSPDGTRLVGLSNTAIVGWDLISGRFIINNARQDALYLFYSIDKTEFYTVRLNGTVAVYNADTGQQIDDFMGHPRFSNVATYDVVNGHLALGGTDGTIHVWDALDRVALAVFSAHQTEVGHLLFSPDGTRLLSSGTDGRNLLWDWQNRQLIHDLSNPSVPTIRMAYAPSGERIAIATNEVITMWDVRSGQFIYSLPMELGGAESLLLFSPDGKFLVNGGAIPNMMVWEGEGDNNFIAYLPNMGNGRISASFSPDSQLLLTAKFEGETALWDMTQITDQTIPRANINPASNRVVFVDWSPDSFTMLFFDAAGSVYVWGLP